MTKLLGSHNTTPAERLAICKMAEAGVDQAKIAETMDRPPRTIRRIIHNSVARGHNEDLPRSGRPHKIDARAMRHIQLEIHKNRRQTLGDITETLNRSISGGVTKKTVANAIHDNLGMSSCVARKKPNLKPGHIARRMVWAEEKLGWTMEEWKRVIFTDESSVELGKLSCQPRVWRSPSEEYLPQCLVRTFKSGRTSVMVWGAIAYNHLGPLIVMPKGMRKGVHYVNLVMAGPLWDFYSKLVEELGVVKVVEDGAPVHTCGLAKSFRRYHGMDSLIHPANSPDLNPIEHVWKKLKTQINDRPVHPRSAIDLEAAIMEEWAKIDVSFINKLIDSMPKRVDAVLEAHGGPTKY